MNSKIGKRIGGRIYVHRSYGCEFAIVEERLAKLKLLFPNFQFDILKIDPKAETVAFIECPDFNTAHEPTVGDSILVAATCTSTTKAPQDPWVYHHKWMMVADDYAGFDVEESKRRSQTWESLNPDRTRIGKKSYWYNWLAENGLEP